MKRIVVASMIFVMAVVLSACGSSESAGKVLTMALPKDYVFAVDVPGFDGDSVPAGMYSFTEAAKKNTVPVVYDIYVLTSEPKGPDALTDAELKGSVGGVEESELDLQLDVGDYVYIKYNSVAGEQGSYITIAPMK